MAELKNQSQTSERQNIQETSNCAPSSRKRVLNNIEKENQVPGKRHKTDCASGLKSSLHGTIYQLKLLMLFLERGLKLNYIFNLETELTEAEKFDDLVFSYKLEGEEKIKYLFLQAKHKQNEEKGHIKSSDLLSTDTSNPFSLQKYFFSYKNIQKNPKFTNASVELKDFIIFTNNKFNKENFKLKNIALEPVIVNDPLLNMTTMGKEAKHYKLEVSSDHNLFKILKKTSDAHLLARKLAEFTHDSIKLTLIPPIFKKYHAALAKDVIDINTRKFKDGFVNREVTLDSSTASFRKLFVKEIRTLHTRYKNEKIWKNEELIKYLERKQFEISSEFGKNIPEQSLPIDIITENEIEEFLDKLVFAVNQPNEIELGEIIQKELGFQLNLRNSELVYGAFQTKIMDWFKECTNKPLSENDVKEILNEIKSKLNTLVVTGISLQHCESIEKYGLSFENEFLDLNNFLKGSDGKQIFHLVTKEEATVISSVRVYNTLKISCMYKQEDSHIFIPVKDLSNKRAQTRVLNAFLANGSHDLLVIDNESEDSTVDLINLCSKLLETILNNPSKKLIIISISNANLASIFSDGSKYEEVNNCCSFIDLSDDSRKTVLKRKVRFQGELIELNKLLDEIKYDGIEHLKIIDTTTLVKLVQKKEITISCPSKQSYVSGAEYIKLYDDISLGMLFEELSFTENDSSLFMVSGVNQAGEFIRLLRDEIDISEDALSTITGKISLISSVDEGKRILISTDNNRERNIDNFIQLSNSASNRIIYWLEVTQHIIKTRNIWKLLYLYNPESFINRQLQSSIIIDKNVFDELSEQDPTDLFLFSNIQSEDEFFELFDINIETLDTTSDDEEENEETKQKQFVENVRNKLVKWCSTEEAENNFMELSCEGKPVHWIQVNEDNEFIWKRSHGKLNRLLQYKPKDRDLFTGNLNEKVVIIADKPGQGKTTILNKVAKMKQKSNWVIFIDLKSCYEEISELPDSDELSIDVVLNFIFAAKKDCFNNSLSKNLLKCYLLYKSPNPPLILFDAFDEIRGTSNKNTSECQAKVLKLLKFINDETNATIYITTRLEKELDLENTLLVFVTKLKEFGKKTQFKYLTNFWMVSLRLTLAASQNNFNTKLGNFARGLIYSEILKKHRNFMCIALQLRMVAEAFWQDLRVFVESESQVISSIGILGNIYELYHKFIDWKYDIYLKEKLGIMPKCPSEVLEILKSSYNKSHSKLAAFEIFPTECFNSHFQNNFEDELTKEVDDFEKEIDLLMLSIQPIGLISGSEFLHRTFAEYFASYLHCNNLRKRRSDPKYQHTKIFLLENIFKKSNSVIFDFMDQNLNTNTEWMFIKKSNLLFYSKKIKGKLEYEISRLLASNESLHDLQNLVEGCMNWHWTEPSYYYNGSLTLIEKLYSKFFTVTDVDELKATLAFLLKAHKKSKYGYANEAIQRSITEAALHYLNYAKHNQVTCDDDFNFCLESLGDSCKLIFNFDLNTYTFDDLLLEMDKLFQSKNLLKYPENLKWLEREGLGISKRLKTLTPIMAEIFTSVIDNSQRSGYESYYASNIFDYLILPLLTYTHNEKKMPNVDKLSLVDMFQNFSEFISTTSIRRFSTINIEQLGALLDSIRPFLEKRELNEEEMSITINCLIKLKLWNINLIDFEQKLLIQDAVGNFRYEFSLINKDEIVKQIRSEIDKSQEDIIDIFLNF